MNILQPELCGFYYFQSADDPHSQKTLRMRLHPRIICNLHRARGVRILLCSILGRPASAEKTADADSSADYPQPAQVCLQHITLLFTGSFPLFSINFKRRLINWIYWI